MSIETVPIERVRELGRENMRRRLRERALELRLVAQAVELEVVRQGLSISAAPHIPLLDIRVVEDGSVVGARQAVEKYRLQK